MKKKIVWLVVSCLIVLSLLMASCAPAVTEEEEVAAPPEEEVVVTEEEVAPSPEEPRYGGEIRLTGAKGATFDPGYGGKGARELKLTNEALLTGDWTKSLAGTGELTWVQVPFFPKHHVGCVAESWEMPDNETMVFHIRQGLHFHNKPPVNGRELTADDVVFSIKRQLEMPLGGLATRYPGGEIKSVTVPDKWTVVIKCIPEVLNRLLSGAGIGLGVSILPADGAGEYPGDFREWETCCGTGPFILVDHVPYGSSTMVRNPDYWRNDPLHPENTLPYVDRVIHLFIDDPSTTRAAFRTGRIDRCGGSWEEAPIMWETYPEAKWSQSVATGGHLIAMRLDTKPFDDIRVRRALAMAIDNQEIADEFYGGNADILIWPVFNIPEFSDMRIPLDELPESTRELFEYHPDKARQLLAEAGYPDGFKTAILCGEAAAQVDMMSLIKEYWAKIGVDLKLDVRSGDALKSLIRDKKHEAMVYRKCSVLVNPYQFAETRSVSLQNMSMINDPHIDELWTRVQEAMYEPECHQMLKEEYVPYVLEKCWYIQPPAARNFTFWQPWLMDYHGEADIGKACQGNWAIYVWIDQELKKELTGR